MLADERDQQRQKPRTINVPPPAKVSIDNGFQEWRRFKRGWNNFEVASRLKTESTEYRCAVFLSCIGEEAAELLDGFSFKEDEKDDNINDVMQKFENYFVGERNEVFEAYVFNQRVQGSAESMDAYVTELRKLAKTCNFGELEDRMIRDRIVVGIANDVVRAKLLEVKGITLDKCIEICRAHEKATEQAQSMTTSDEKIHKIKKHNHKSKPKSYHRAHKPHEKEQKVTCTRCGYMHTKSRCPAYGQKCANCSKFNHFQKCCKEKKKNVHSMHDDSSDTNSENIDSDTESENEINDITICVLTKPKAKIEGKELLITADVHNQSIIFKVDTGAQANILPLHMFKTLDPKPVLKKTKTKLTSYTGEQLNTAGVCNLNVMGKELKFFVVKTNQRPILGLEATDKLNIIQILGVEAEKVYSQYPEIFEELGCIGEPHHIELDPTVKPVIQPPRRVPFAMKGRIKEELDRMEQLGVIEKQEGPTDWVSSMVVVEKPDKSLRICMDPKDLNKAVKREHFVMPTVEEITAELDGAEFFTKLDAQSGFWQIPLDEESSKLCCMQTPFGRYVFKRLPMGLASASEVFHRTIKEMFSDIPRVENWIDDIMLSGRTQKEHDEILNKTLNRAKERNLTLKKKKCEFSQKEIKYIGHIISKEGIRPDPQKIEAIQNMAQPKSKKDLQRYLGMVNYLGKFCPRLAEYTGPLRILLQKKVEWQWNHEQEEAFKKTKEMLTRAPILAHFKTNKPVKITTDASSVGLGCALLQNEKPVAYASRSLTETEQRYAQIEKETLAIVFACEKFHQYIYGKQCAVETDHKPIESIWKKPLNRCPPRIQRLMLRLQKYDLSITYKPGKEMFVADTLSRATTKESHSQCEVDREQEEILRIHVNNVLENLNIEEQKKEKLRKETEQDKELNILKAQIQKGWPANKNNVPNEIRQYFQYNEELSIIDDLIFKADRLVIPKSMQSEMLERIHEGHQGIEKCKNRAREHMFWPSMNQHIENMVQSCHTCIKHRNKQQKEPLLSHEVPHKPWQKVGTDLFKWENHDYVLVADYYSKFIEFHILPDTKSSTVVTYIKSIFSRHGIPEEVISDNGPQYASKEFAKFAEKWEFKHTTSSPRYPQSNGFAERMVQTLKNLLQKARDSGNDPYLAVLNYRSTPVSNTIPSPAEILMNRQLRTRLNTPSKKSRKKTNGIREKLKERQMKQKQYYDKGAKELPILKPKEHVYLNENDEWKPAVVVRASKSPRSYYIQTETGILRRNRKFLMKVEKKNKKRTDEKTHNSKDSGTGKKTHNSKSSTNFCHQQYYMEQDESDSNNEIFPQTKDTNEKTVKNNNMQNRKTTQNQETTNTDHANVTTRSGRLVKIPNRMNEYFL